MSAIFFNLNNSHINKIDKEATCGICLDSVKSKNNTFIPGKTIVAHKTGESHPYHRECIKEWFERSETCPGCRAPAELHSMTFKELLIKEKKDISKDLLIGTSIIAINTALEILVSSVHGKNPNENLIKLTGMIFNTAMLWEINQRLEICRPKTFNNAAAGALALYLAINLTGYNSSSGTFAHTANIVSGALGAASLGIITRMFAKCKNTFSHDEQL